MGVEETRGELGAQPRGPRLTPEAYRTGGDSSNYTDADTVKSPAVLGVSLGSAALSAPASIDTAAGYDRAISPGKTTDIRPGVSQAL